MDAAKAEAAAGYVQRSNLLPLAVRKTAISCSTATPFRAVVIEIENTAELRSFRAERAGFVDAVEPEWPHISLLYTVDEHGERPGWWSSGKRLQAIAEECAALIEATEFGLDDPVIVAPDGDWTKITTWNVVRKL